MQKIGRYEIVRELGRGGMAIVYLARDPLIDRQVAVKVLPRQFTHDVTFSMRFRREAKVIAALEHPAIVPVYDFGEHDGQPFIVMRYMSGGSLRERLSGKAMTLRRVEEIISRIAPALDEAHARGIVHRDLKPDNILFDERDRPYLSDFGIVKLASGQQTSLTVSGGALGTPAYMSPEQARAERDLDGRSDVYSLGVIVFEMLTGKRPYDADTPMGMAMKHVLDPVPVLADWRPDLGPMFGPVLNAALAKAPDARFQSAGALATAVREALAGKQYDPEKRRAPESVTTLLGRWTAWNNNEAGGGRRSRRGPVLLALLGILFLVGTIAVVVAAVIYSRQENVIPVVALEPSDTAALPTPTPEPVAVTRELIAETASPSPTATPTMTPDASATAALLTRDAADSDCDRDGLTDVEEAELGTETCRSDSDSDGLSDFVEVAQLGSDPLRIDSDNDNLFDGVEAAEGSCTSPVNADTDGDGLPDATDPAPCEAPTPTPTPTATAVPVTPPTPTRTPTPTAAPPILVSGANYYFFLRTDGVVDIYREIGFQYIATVPNGTYPAAFPESGIEGAFRYETRCAPFATRYEVVTNINNEVIRIQRDADGSEITSQYWNLNLSSPSALVRILHCQNNASDSRYIIIVRDDANNVQLYQGWLNGSYPPGRIMNGVAATIYRP